MPAERRRLNDGTAAVNARAVKRRSATTVDQPQLDQTSRRRSTMNRALWTVQVLLALFFALASGAPKLLLPPEAFPEMPIPLPSAFVLFIGVAEVAGALGLILPGVLKVRTGLTPLAAGGLMLITLGATGYWLLAGDALGNAAFAFGMALLCAFVTYGRSRLVPHRRAAREPALHLAN
jgi:DoxX-like protein